MKSMNSFRVLSKISIGQGIIFPFALCFLLLLSSTSIAQNQPSWVSSRPINSMYYTGIGSALKSEKDYMKIAKKKALSDLISEIEVKVASNSLLNTVDDNGTISSYFKENIQMKASKKIEDYELVEAWESDTEYWVYYQLNKYDYKEKERIRVERMLQKTYDLLVKAKENKGNGNISAAILNCIEGIELMQFDLNKNLPYQKNGQTLYLGNELFQLLTTVFNGVEIKVNPSKVEAQIFQPVKEKITIQVSRGMQQQVINLPLKVEFKIGSGEISSNLQTNTSGFADLQILNVSSKKQRQSLLIQPDIKQLLPNSKNRLVRSILQKIKSIPQAQVSIQLAQQSFKAFLKQESKENTAILKSVKRILSNQYFNFVPNEQLADVIVEVKDEFKKGGLVNGEMYNMQEYFTSFQLKITNRYSKETVFTYSVDQLRSLVPESTSVVTARMSSSRNMIKKMQRKLVKELKSLQMEIDKTVVVPNFEEEKKETSKAPVKVNVEHSILVPSGLLAYYTFDDGTSANLTGLTNYNAIVQGDHAPMCVTSTLTGNGKTALFSGNSYLSIAEHPIQNWSAYTINVWVKTSSGGAILGRKGKGATILGTTLQNKLFYKKESSNNYGFFQFDTEDILLNGKWHMLTLSVEPLQNETRARVFIDGQMVLVENIKIYNEIAKGQGASIGYDPGSERYFTGELDNLRIYNRKLKDEEIQTLYQKHQ